MLALLGDDLATGIGDECSVWGEEAADLPGVARDRIRFHLRHQLRSVWIVGTERDLLVQG
jgi:hypothetical protein